MATHTEVKSAPLPPYSSGTASPNRPELAHRVDDVDREVVVAVPLRHVRGDLGLGEIAYDLAEGLVVGGQLEHHSLTPAP